MKDPRGPIRTIVAIEERADATMVTMDCGHVGKFNQAFYYKIGSESRCLKCATDTKGATGNP